MTSSGEDPSITLGGVSYAVPPIAFREVSKILPLVDTIFNSVRANDLSENVIEGLGKIIYYGLKRGLEGLSYDDFIDRPATVSEMMNAALVVCRQAGLKTKDVDPGEAAGEKIPLQTSTN
jgi:hypothetical protein